MEISIFEKPSFSRTQFEVVERKGMGHPDTLCDSIAEAVCQKLCNYYYSNFGFVLPHHMNKVMIVGGGADVGFGRGELKRPIRVFLAGSAVDKVEDANGTHAVETFDIAKEAAAEYLTKILPFLSVEKQVIFENLIKGAKFDLRLLDKSDAITKVSEDTSIGVGYAPLSATELLTLEIEGHINSKEFKSHFPEIGAEVKLMVVRAGNRLKVIAVCGMISSLTKSLSHYVEMKEVVANEIRRISEKRTSSRVAVQVNCNDSIDPKLRLTTRVGVWGGGGEPYLLVTGTHAERGKGQTGRGNRSNGLITPMRPMSIEGVAGKMPSHPGKLYNLLAFRISRELLTIPSVEEAEVFLVSRGGSRIDNPEKTLVGVTKTSSDESSSKEMKRLVAQRIKSAHSIAKEILVKPERVC